MGGASVSVGVGVGVHVGVAVRVAVGARPAINALIRDSATMLVIPRQYSEETPRKITMSTTCSALARVE